MNAQITNEIKNIISENSNDQFSVTYDFNPEAQAWVVRLSNSFCIYEAKIDNAGKFVESFEKMLNESKCTYEYIYAFSHNWYIN